MGIAALVMEVIALIEGIIYLTKSDEEFFARLTTSATEQAGMALAFTP